MFFPDRHNERFNFTADVGLLVSEFIVEGSGRPADRSHAVGASTSSGRVLSMSSNPPPACKKGTGSSQSATVKVAYAVAKKVGNKLEFKKLHQAFIKVVESTANIHYLTHAARGKWGENLVLVTADGMPLEDGSGTQGELI